MASKIGLPIGGLAASLQKAKDALKIQKQIADKLKGLKEKGMKLPGRAAESGPKPLRLDDKGREIDDNGNLIGQEESKTAADSARKASIGAKKHQEEGEGGAAEEAFLDPRMRAAPEARRKRATLEFVQEGRFQKLAQRERMQFTFTEMGGKGGKGSGTRRDRGFVGNANAVPLGSRPAEPQQVAVEWWDAIILRDGKYFSGPGGESPGPSSAEAREIEVIPSKITSYVEHPVPIDPPNEKPEPPPQPLKLTKVERKKLRTQRRQAREKEKQEMIMQGLLEPPKPKVKISNLVRVLGEDATQDPTKIEKEVRRQMQERQQAHDDRNLARKLTPAERRDKKMRKMFDPENGLFMAVFKIKSLKNPQHKYKINVNADQNMLTGCVLTGDTFSLVVIEGCAKSVVRYKKLVLKRMQWDAWIAGEEAPEDMEGNYCKLLWEGTIQSAHFKKFRREVEKSDASARKYLDDFGVGHLWDLGVGEPQNDP
ncbi:U4/U6 small nuclear ribonucleoprotein Prp3 [Chloropicon primus]|nr:U4/U6 small nuclear ribonucleoprotein Prp3 [Chloropicon primus]UPR00399.1 U4/U6 small nuclear ribonucleoprotein Prp3 [Chloropicon primus]|eukprot:QDZ21187.1 U4/U6 small nuclear ribonucleoprotein Prp3 [Chloropicon primus]